MPGRVREEGSRWPKMKCSTSGVSIKAGALRVLRNLDPASLNVLLGCQAEGEGMAASFRLRLRDGTFKASFPRVQRDLLNFLSTKTGKIILFVLSARTPTGMVKFLVYSAISRRPQSSPLSI